MATGGLGSISVLPLMSCTVLGKLHLKKGVIALLSVTNACSRDSNEGPVLQQQGLRKCLTQLEKVRV